MRTRTLGIWIAAAVVGLDQLVKQLVRMRLDYGDSTVIVPGFMNFTRVHNTGAAFGMLNPVDFPFKPVVMTLLPVVALLGLSFYAASLGTAQRLSRLGLAFVIGGAAGNLIDRVAAGYVLDFVDVYWGDWHFWAFNVADTAINVVVGLMILDLLGVGRQRVP
jgi:signal peptidase II